MVYDVCLRGTSQLNAYALRRKLIAVLLVCVGSERFAQPQNEDISAVAEKRGTEENESQLPTYRCTDVLWFLSGRDLRCYGQSVEGA